jgi:hypothetical protein
MNTIPRRRSQARSLLATVAVAIPAMLIGAGLSAPAQAAYTVTLAQVGTSVVATGSGTLDLTGLSYLETTSDGAFIWPDVGGYIHWAFK